MQLKEVTSNIIPGYNFLTEEEQKAFESSEVGQKFVRVANEILSSIHSHSAKLSLWNVLFSNYMDDKQKLRESNQEKIKSLLEEIGRTDEYNEVVDKIIIYYLIQQYSDMHKLIPDFPEINYLSKEEQSSLARAEFSEIIFTHLIPLESKFVEAESSSTRQYSVTNRLFNSALEQLRAKKERILREWVGNYSMMDESPLLKEAITQKKKDEQVLDMICRIIPGYQLLIEEEKTAFTSSEVVGQPFVEYIEENLSPLNESSEERKLLLAEYEKTEEYQTLRTQIIRHWLIKEYPDLALLSNNQQLTLAGTDFSKVIQTTLLDIEDKISKAQNEPAVNDGNASARQEELSRLNSEKEALISGWNKRFMTQEEMVPLRKSIAESKAQQRAQQLAEKFPLLTIPISADEPNPVAQLTEKYALEFLKEKADIARVEEEFLTALLFDYVHKAVSPHFSFITLNRFNQNQANLLAKKMLQAFNNHEAMQMDSWFASFNEDLIDATLKNIRSVKLKEQEPDNISGLAEMVNSLSSLFWQSKAVNKVTEFVNDVSDTHALFQTTGLSSQNEGSLLAILDLNNYRRYKAQIVETKSIFASLLKPFMPLYDEYKDIAAHEKNAFKKILRIVMPMLIIALIFIGVGALLAPLGLPELVFLLIAIPLLIVSLAAAAKYVTLKNDVSQYLTEKWHGGPFEIHEFQINDRMIHIFKSEQTAEIIRRIYVKELETCDALEASYRAKYEKGTLNKDELLLRKENMEKRLSIAMEWFDIHSNSDLGTDQVPKIVIKRLSDLAKKELDVLDEILQKEDLSTINDHVKLIVDQLKTVLRPEVEVIVALANNAEQGLVENDVQRNEENNVPQGPELLVVPAAKVSAKNYTPSFFRPKCLEKREELQHLTCVVEVLEKIAPR